MDAIKNPVDACEELYRKIVILSKQIAELGEAQNKRKNFVTLLSYKIILLFGRKLVSLRELWVDACKMDKTRKGDSALHHDMFYYDVVLPTTGFQA